MNYTTFKDNSASFIHCFNEGEAHPENFYCEFYDDFIAPELDSLLTSEDKEEWVKEWQEDLELEGEDAELEFEEIIEQFDCLGEDITAWLVDNNESIKEKFLTELFTFITQSWSEKEINDCVNTKENN